jgi:hypothetical protein
LGHDHCALYKVSFVQDLYFQVMRASQEPAWDCWAQITLIISLQTRPDLRSSYGPESPAQA